MSNEPDAASGCLIFFAMIILGFSIFPLGTIVIDYYAQAACHKGHSWACADHPLIAWPE